MAATAGTCTSTWYCPPETLVPTYRVWRDVKYTFVQFWQLFPFLAPLYAPFEKAFDARPSFEWISNHWWPVYTSMALYLAMVHFLPRFFKDRPVKLGKTLAYWNLFLAVYSTMGALRTAPHLLWFVANHSFKETVCMAPYRINGDGATGLWVLLFTLSKIVELVDSLFICLKGRKPIFLHWYHHASVLYFSWAAHKHAHPGFYFIAMNYTVHSVMYSYYYLMAIDRKPEWLNPMYITVMQIAQMVVGVIVSLAGFYYNRQDPTTCEVHPYVMRVSAVIYASYLYLFCEFMVKRFFLKTTHKANAKATAKAAKSH